MQVRYVNKDFATGEANWFVLANWFDYLLLFKITDEATESILHKIQLISVNPFCFTENNKQVSVL